MAGGKAPAPEQTTMARLRWRCRRGMGELDQLLGHFLEHHYTGLNAVQRALFASLLEQEDDH